MSTTAELYSGCVFLSILSKSFPKQPQNSHPQQEYKKGAAPLLTSLIWVPNVLFWFFFSCYAHWKRDSKILRNINLKTYNLEICCSENNRCYKQVPSHLMCDSLTMIINMSFGHKLVSKKTTKSGEDNKTVVQVYIFLREMGNKRM